MIENLLVDTVADDCELWLSGPINFRKAVYPEYKANRIGKPRPRYEQEVKKYLVSNWKAEYTAGIEADDQMGIRQLTLSDGILVHLDKDLNSIPGWHFNWELRRQGEVVRASKLYNVTQFEADRFFWYQLIVGDSVDNIKGIVGMGPKAADRFLDNHDPKEWYQGILDMYGSDEEMDLNAQCVYIWRKPNDSWRNLVC